MQLGHCGGHIVHPRRAPPVARASERRRLRRRTPAWDDQERSGPRRSDDRNARARAVHAAARALSQCAEAVGERRRACGVAALALDLGERSARMGSGPQAAVGAVWRQSLSRLWAALASRHSDLAAALPRRRKRSMRRLNLVSAKTGSTITWRLA